MGVGVGRRGWEPGARRPLGGRNNSQRVEEIGRELCRVRGWLDREREREGVRPSLDLLCAGRGG